MNLFGSGQDDLARSTLRQHMDDCVRRQDKIDLSLATIRSDIARQDVVSDTRHEQNRSDVAALRKETSDGRQRLLFWLLTTAGSIIVGMIGVLGSLMYLIMKNGRGLP